MSWWNSLFGKKARDPLLDSELHFHIEELTNANIAAGMPPAEARRHAVLEFGGREQIKEELRDVYRVPIVESAPAHLKSAFRFIRKSPSFSIAVILTLALGSARTVQYFPRSMRSCCALYHSPMATN